MFLKSILFAFLLVAAAEADAVAAAVATALGDLAVVSSPIPYSKSIHRVHIGRDAAGAAKRGVAVREVTLSSTAVTIMVVVEKTPKGPIARGAFCPDTAKIKNKKERERLRAVLARFQDAPFDPHAEKSAVDGLSGATSHDARTMGYLNHMARQTALLLEHPPTWTDSAQP